MDLCCWFSIFIKAKLMVLAVFVFIVVAWVFMCENMSSAYGLYF